MLRAAYYSFDSDNQKLLKKTIEDIWTKVETELIKIEEEEEQKRLQRIEARKKMLTSPQSRWPRVCF